eukprot:6559050-Pyramimonas_sp.AAC.1
MRVESPMDDGALSNMSCSKTACGKSTRGNATQAMKQTGPTNGAPPARPARWRGPVTKGPAGVAFWHPAGPW